MLIHGMWTMFKVVLLLTVTHPRRKLRENNQFKIGECSDHLRCDAVSNGK